MRDAGNELEAGTARADGSGRVSFLDQALWKRFREAETIESFARSWLALQCSMIGDVRSGVLVLGAPDAGPYVPAAFWPEGMEGDATLSTAAEMALKERRGVVRGTGSTGPRKGQDCQIAFPLLFSDRLHGVVALEMANPGETEMRRIMRALRWGAAWIELAVQRQQDEGKEQRHVRTALALDLIAAAVEEEGFRAACNAAVTELATRLECERVSIGFVRRKRAVVDALSHTASFGKRVHLVRALGAAMDEAIDQRTPLLFPFDPETAFYVARAHEELARAHKAGSVFTVPLMLKDRSIGALTFEAAEGKQFDEATMALCECVGAAIGPILDEKRRNDRLLLFKAGDSLKRQAVRLFGPRYLGRKLVAAGAAIVVAFFAIAHGDHTVTSPGILEGSVHRVVVAPFDGNVLSEQKRAGDTVQSGDVLAILDDKDLVVEQVRWIATRRQYLTQYDRALAERNRAEINVLRAQIDQADAQIMLYDEQISRARLTAPFEGIVASGDLSQSIGSAVQRGDVLFELSPLDQYRIILEVDEGDVTNVRPGQSGRLLLSSIPDEPMAYTVDKITPVAVAQEGRNAFRVEASLHDVSPRLRPGMKGVGKTVVDRRRLIWIWTHKLFDWLRVWAWAWLP